MNRIALLLLLPGLVLLACNSSRTAPPDGSDGQALDGDGGRPAHPTYAANAANWTDGAPQATLEVTVDGLEVTARGSGLDPSPGGSIAACSYNFGGDAAPVEVAVDAQGTCEPVVHTYDAAGGYDVVLAVWDQQGMVGQTYTMIQVGPVTSATQRAGTHIGGCLEAYWWTPDSGGPFPAMVHYTPYRIADSSPPLLFLASGLAVVLVTNRGQGSSCDPTDTFGPIARQDLTLIAQWLADEPWATGDFCLWGHSGPGIMGALSSTVKPDGLKCVFVGGGDTKFYEGLYSKSGAWWPVASLWILGTYGVAALQDPAVRIPALIHPLVSGHENARQAAFFDERDLTAALTNLDLPILFETSWDDLAWGGGPAGGPYLAMTQHLAHPGSAQIIYAGPHPSFDPSNQRPFRAEAGAGIFYLREVRRFLVHYLLGGPAPASESFNYLYYRLRGGVQAAWMNRQAGGWQTANTWPPAGASPVRLYLGPEASGTISARLDGTLGLAAPAEQSLPAFPYQATPVWDPVYSSNASPWRFYTFPDLRPMDKAGLSFTSPPIEADAVVEGPVDLTLSAETSLYDFDWMAVLSDVWPDGSSHRLSSGFVRASLRNNLATFEPRPQGQQTYRLHLASIANEFQAGHRIRLTLHQVNTTDAAPESKDTTLWLGDGKAELVLHVQDSALQLQPQATCTDCDPHAEPQESLAAFKRRYLTGGILGTDPVSGAQVSFGFFASVDEAGQGGGMVVGTLPNGSSTGVVVEGVGPAGEAGYHHRLALPNGIAVDVRCTVEDDPGTVLLRMGGTTVGPLQVTAGGIRCYDVPYVNWQ